MLRHQRPVGALHDIALQQELAEFRLLHLQHFAQLAKAKRLFDLHETVEKLGFRGEESQLLLRPLTLFILLGPSARGGGRVGKVRQAGVTLALLPAIEHFGSKRRRNARHREQRVAFIQQELLTHLPFPLVQINADGLGQTLRRFQAFNHALHFTVGNTCQRRDFTAAHCDRLILSIKIFQRNHHRFHHSFTDSITTTPGAL
ncbi:hypothetical protein BN132_879 [Cronobacter turicensis 564]|nr:hypothetical protein BN132_879 [Cronobacter turicensis 564]